MVMSAKDAYWTLNPVVLIGLGLGVLVSRALGDRFGLGWSLAAFAVAGLAGSIISDTYNAACYADWCGTMMPRESSYELRTYASGLEGELKRVTEDPDYAPVSKNGPVRSYRDHPELAVRLRSTYLADFEVSQQERIVRARDDQRHAEQMEARPLWKRIPGGVSVSSSWFVPAAIGYLFFIALGSGFERLWKRKKAASSTG